MALSEGNDILDIDEILKDDSFTALPDKTHDDVSNILQQWRINDNTTATTTTTFCIADNQFLQQSSDQAFKSNSRTFTRPKRKSAQNLESQFTDLCNNDSYANKNCKTSLKTPILNVQTGGLVTTAPTFNFGNCDSIQRSLLQDVSPPASIISSEISMGGVADYLMTSRDFSDFLSNSGAGENLLMKASKIAATTFDCDTAFNLFNEEADTAITKDSQISQIDDISLTLNKIGSGYSTMNNSMETASEKTTDLQYRALIEQCTKNFASESENIDEDQRAINDMTFKNEIQTAMVLNDELLLSNVTMDLIGSTVSSICLSSENHAIDDDDGDDGKLISLMKASNVTQIISTDAQPVKSDSSESLNSTFKKDNTQIISEENKLTETFTAVQPQMIPSGDLTPDGLEKFQQYMRFSTPHTSKNLHFGSVNAKFIPSMQPMHETSNISPISSRSPNKNFTFNISDIQRLDNPHEDKNDDIGIVMGLTKTEAELYPMLANEQNEESFEHMLEEIGNHTLNVEQVKMNKTLESIKRRLNCFSKNENPEEDNRNPLNARKNQENTISSYPPPNKTSPSDFHHSQGASVRSKSAHSKQGGNSQLMSGDLKPSFSNSESNLDDNLKTTMIIQSSCSSSYGNTERLLSRRSRLCDDVNIDSIKAHSGSRSESGNVENFNNNNNNNSNNNNSNNNNISSEERNQLFTEIKSKFIDRKIMNAGPSENVTNTNPNEIKESQRFKNRIQASASSSEVTPQADADRFKTIKIIKNFDNPNEPRVPCIDDDHNVAEVLVNRTVKRPNKIPGPPSRLQYATAASSHESKFMYSQPSVIANANNVFKVPSNMAPQSKLVNKFSTFRKLKPDQRATKDYGQRDSEASSTLNETFQQPTQRLPMQIPYHESVKSSGAISKASSLDLEQLALHLNDNSETQASHFKNTFQGSSTSKLLQMRTKNSGSSSNVIDTNNENPETKKPVLSPLGTKAKSLHNLTSNFGFNSNLSVPHSSFQRYGAATSHFGLRKNNSGNLLADKEKAAPMTQERRLGERQLTQTITYEEKQAKPSGKGTERASAIPKTLVAPIQKKRSNLPRPASLIKR